MSSSSKNANSLSVDLNNFIYGVSRRNFQNAPDLTKTGISLLKNFPAARDAVLEYFAMVFHEAVNYSVKQVDYDNDQMANPQLEAVSMIGPDLCALGESWAPFIVPWSISLLKDIATNKGNFSNVTLQNLDPVRILLDIATQNLTLLNPEERAKCIDVLLGSSQCDWVVGHVGRVEPWLVVPRALQLGLDSAGPGQDHAVAILQHLPRTHKQHIRQALIHLFQEAIRHDSKMEKKKDIIPYLLNLATKSDTVLQAITQDIDEILTDGAVEYLMKTCPLMRNIPSWEGVGPTSLVALLIRADINTFMLLLRHSKTNLFCRQLLEYLLQKLEYESLFPDNKIPLLLSAAEEIDMVREKLLTGNQLEQYSIARILILVGHQLSYEFVNTISFLLQYSRSDTTLALLVRIISSTLSMHCPSDSADVNLDNDRCNSFITTGVENALRNAMLSDTQLKRCNIEGDPPKDQKTYLHHFCLNVTTLLRWENSNKVSHLRGRPVARACEASLQRLGGALEAAGAAGAGAGAARALAALLDRLDVCGARAPPPPLEALLKLSGAVVKHFFRCIHEEDILAKIQGTQTACRLLRKLCLHSKLARAVALRELLETAMFREEEIFGSAARFGNQSLPDWKEELLMHANQKHGPITQLTQSHTSVFHAGIIGKGVRHAQSTGNTNDYPPILTLNIELLMGALMACMEGAGVVEGMTSVSLLLVELVSPDVMYNGLPWPDEDFTKQVSIERELYMRAALAGSAPARAALRRAARSRPALCYSSALLRALAATLLHRHRAAAAGDADAHARDRFSTSDIRNEAVAMDELLETMTLGQLLPHPLSHMLLLVPHLTPNEIVQVLRDCLWNYTRDHVPSPALFTCDSTGLHWRDTSACKPPIIYTDALRIIIQKRISKLGYLYPVMFLNLEKSEN